MDRGNIIVLGAGITGVCSAEQLRRDGWNVTLIDRIEPGSPEQTSFGNGGLLARASVIPVPVPGLLPKIPSMLFNPASPLFLQWRYLPKLIPWIIPYLRQGSADNVRRIAAALAPMVMDTADQHLAFSAGTAAAAFIQQGEYVFLYGSRAEYEKEAFTAGLRRDHGLIPTLLDRSTLVDRDPNLGPDYGFGVAFDKYGWISSPSGYVRALFEHFRANGGKFVLGEVKSALGGAAPTVEMENGDVLHAEKLVLSAGVWSTRFARRMGVRINMEAERGYHVTMHRPNLMPPNPYMVTDSKFLITPMDESVRAAGVVEFGGIDAPPSNAPLNVLKTKIKRVYPKLEFEKETTWMGRRPSTPDSLPVIGESERAQNVLHAYGGQHVGLTIGPKVGRLIADLAANRRPNIDMSPYRVDRF